MAYKRKLIEVAIPLAAINEQSAREKTIRHGHPASLHLWWARRPLATARAVLFSQLVDDPSERTEEFRAQAVESGTTEVERWVAERIEKERGRLFDLISRMVNWDNLNDEGLFDEVRAEILRSTDGNPPAILDPFAGGGAIPLEAQRLGLEANASDLNPVAVLINKSLIEFPPKFAGRAPVFPHAAAQRNAWPRMEGLAEDVQRYGEWMRDEAERRIGELYPKSTLPDGTKATVIAWIWARTVVCPNPACAIETPLVRSWSIGKKKGREARVVPEVVNGRVEFSVVHNADNVRVNVPDGTVGRAGAICVSCQTTVPLSYIREQGRSVGLGEVLMATVAEGVRRRIYLTPTEQDRKVAAVARPDLVPAGELGHYPRDIKAPIYGLKDFSSLFTNRQLVALTTFSDLVGDVRERVLSDARASGAVEGPRLEEGGQEAAAYADAVATYLAMTLDKLADLGNSLVRWEPVAECPRQLFGRQAIPMVWDFAEANPLSSSSGSFDKLLEGFGRALNAPSLANVSQGRAGIAEQADAATRSYERYVISTDPPYYDNIGYSDLSDFFYVWLRRSLQEIHPALLSTMLVPKAEELVANPHRHGGPEGAKDFFETGFEHVFELARGAATSEYPMTVYYAFKQSESDFDGSASTGWETILGSMVHAGWTVTATWPMRTENTGRMMSQGMNALASSVVLALRPRPLDAPTTDRRGFIAALKRDLAPALRDLQSGGIAPVDLPQAAIGPGMAVFSRYSSVIESDGLPMPVRAALARINEVLDEVLTEQEGDFDPVTRFALAWYRGHGYDSASFGDAEDLARARGTAVSAMERSGILSARAGRVQLYRPSDLADDYDVLTDSHTSAWEALHHAIRVLSASGIGSAGAFLKIASKRTDGAVDLDLVKELAYLVFQIAEKNGWNRDAQSFNDIATSWGDMLRAEQPAATGGPQLTLDFGEDD